MTENADVVDGGNTKFDQVVVVVASIKKLATTSLMWKTRERRKSYKRVCVSNIINETFVSFEVKEKRFEIRGLIGVGLIQFPC